MGAGLRVTWLGHATTLVELDGVRILTDPVLTRRVGPLRNTAPLPRPDTLAGIDAVLVSHVHRDHLDLPSLQRLAPGTRVVCPRGAGRLLDRAGRWDVEELEVGDEVQVGPVGVRATYADHVAIRNRRGRAVLALGYVVRGSRSVYFAGDTEVFPQLAELADGLDVALLPVGGWGLTLGPGHMDPAEAAEATRLLRPRLAVPIHWGTLRLPLAWRLRPALFTEPGLAFERHARLRVPATTVHIAVPGQPLHVDP